MGMPGGPHNWRFDGGTGARDEGVLRSVNHFRKHCLIREPILKSPVATASLTIAREFASISTRREIRLRFAR
ncbi:Uncharacterised protein [Xylophilus ampelinus]|nr:Uncharacterised protein [Xylophilus ampelinus]